MIKGSIQEEDMTILNTYAPNIQQHTMQPQYIRQTLTDIKREIDSNTIIVGDFKTPLTPMAAKSLQSCPTLCDPIGGGPPGSPVPGILQARTLEWVAISFSNA